MMPHKVGFVVRFDKAAVWLGLTCGHQALACFMGTDYDRKDPLVSCSRLTEE